MHVAQVNSKRWWLPAALTSQSLGVQCSPCHRGIGRERAAGECSAVHVTGGLVEREQQSPHIGTFTIALGDTCSRCSASWTLSSPICLMACKQHGEEAGHAWLGQVGACIPDRGTAGVHMHADAKHMLRAGGSPPAR